MLNILVWPGRAALISAVSLLGACSPTLDWREVRPGGSGLVALFPCKPTGETRMVVLEGLPMKLNMHACEAGGATYAVATGDTGDPARVGPVMNALLAAQVGNLGAAASAARPFEVNGMTPNPQARRVTLAGRFPDGTAVNQEAALFSRGTWVIQALVMGPRLNTEAVDTFFEGFRMPS